MVSTCFLKMHSSICFFKLLLYAFTKLFQSAFGLPWCLLGAYCIAKILVKLFSRNLSSIFSFFNLKYILCQFYQTPELNPLHPLLLLKFWTDLIFSHLPFSSLLYSPYSYFLTSSICLLENAFSLGFQTNAQAIGIATMIPLCTES